CDFGDERVDAVPELVRILFADRCTQRNLSADRGEATWPTRKSRPTRSVRPRKAVSGGAPERIAAVRNRSGRRFEVIKLQSLDRLGNGGNLLGRSVSCGIRRRVADAHRIVNSRRVRLDEYGRRTGDGDCLRWLRRQCARGGQQCSNESTHGESPIRISEAAVGHWQIVAVNRGRALRGSTPPSLPSRP